MISPILKEHFESALRCLNRQAGLYLVLEMREQVSQRHSHWLINETPKFYMQLRGGQSINYPGGMVELNAGEVCILAPHIPHWEEHRGLPDAFAALVINLRNNRMQAIAPGCAENCQRRGIADRQFLNNDFRPAALELLRLLVNRHIQLGENERWELLRAFLNLGMQALLQVQSEISSHPQPVLLAMQIARERAGDSSLNVAAIARELGYSPEQLSRLFSHHAGTGLKAYLMQQRLELARSILLAQRHLRISEIAFMAGFSSAGYFCTCFRNHMNISAVDYRVKHADDSGNTR